MVNNRGEKKILGNLNLKLSLNKLFLVILFYVSPVVDMISGYLVLVGVSSEGGFGSIGQLFRLLIMLGCFLILRKKPVFFFTSMLAIAWLLFFEYYYFLFHNSLSGFLVGIAYGSKLIYLVLIFCVLHYQYKSNLISFYSLLKFIRNYTFIIALSLIFSFIFDIGFKTYYTRAFGTKGFYASGNGLGVLMGVGLLLSIYYWKLYKKKYSLLISLIICTASILITTKTSLIFSIIGLFFIILFLKSRLLSLLVISVLVTCIIKFSEVLFSTLSLIFDVVYLRFQNSPSVLLFLMSNRDVFAIDALNSIDFNGIYIFRLIIGFGVFISFRNPNGIFTMYDTLESDFFDVLFMYGVVGLLIYLAVVVFFLYKGIKNKCFFLVFIFILLIAHSLIAGHVLLNGMSGSLVPMLMLLILMYNKNNYKINHLNN